MSRPADSPGPPGAPTPAELKELAPILLVDDNAGKRTALRAVLAPLGYPIVEADSGRAALRCLLARNFAVILLDVRMPMMDGFETAGLIRQRRQSETTPIIFITSYAIDELGTSDRYVEGAVDFMFAPVPPDELRAKVQVFLTLFTKAESLATAAREVQTTADQLRLLTEAAPIGIFQTDEENRYVYTNPQWTAITGIRPDLVAGRPWDSIIGPEQPAGVPAGTADFSRRFEIEVPDVGTRVVVLTSRAVPDLGGGIAGWVGTLADVTAEAGVEAAISAARDKANEGSQLKSDFLANMSHEIRTPMNGVIGMTDLLLETDLDDRQRDYAQTVRNSGEALLTIIDEILDFSKVEAGELRIEEIDLDVAAVVADVVDLLAGSARAKDLDFIPVIGAGVPRVVGGDPGRVRQVLTNLIGNAIKFTRVGEVVVRVSGPDLGGGDTAHPTGLLRFEVSDTGDGIAPDKLAAVFRPFIQVDSSTSRKYGGTGLGLTISSQLVTLMGGECGVTSEPGVGSTFWFTIRVGIPVGTTTPDLPAADPGLRGKRALIVDRSATQRGVLAGYLGEWGLTVESVSSGRTGLELLRAAAAAGEPFDITVVDRTMPGQDVLDLREAVRVDAALSAHVVGMNPPGWSDSSCPPGSPLPTRCTLLSKPVHREQLRAGLSAAMRRTAADTPAGARIPRPPAGRPGQDVRLLLAEDNAVNRKVALTMLEGAGYHVDAVVDGATAVQAWRAARYDAILMDCQMPEMNGYEATAAIRALEGAGRHTPIIAMTAGARREDAERCLAAGMDSYLSKPVSKESLLALVARSVDQTRSTPLAAR